MPKHPAIAKDIAFLQGNPWYQVYCTVSALILVICFAASFSTKTVTVMPSARFAANNAALFTVPLPALTPKNRSMSTKPLRIVIFPSDVIAIYQCSASTASRKLDQCKDALKKQKHQTLSIKEFCQYYDLNYTDVCQQLNLI